MKPSTSVIGLGQMGAALARTLLDHDYPLHVWNRTAAKAQPLVDAGAIAAASAREAVAASDVIVICVGNYTDTNAVLAGCNDWTGKTLIQLTSGDVNEAEDLQTWVTERGAVFLDGVILAYPSGIGAEETVLAIAGGEDTWSTNESLIRCFGGASLYMGSNLMAPLALEYATTIPALLATLGLIQGAQLLESVGFDLSSLPDLMVGMAPLMRDSLERQARVIATDNYKDTEAALKTWAEAVSHSRDSMGALGYDVSLLEPASAILNKAVAAGYGDEELAAVIKVLRADASQSSG